MGTWLKIVGWVGGVAGTVLLAVYLLLYDVWTVPTDDPLLSASVEPTLTAGDVVLVARHGSVGRGDLLRCADPQAPGRFVVARAIGTDGEHVELNGEVLTVDGHRTPSPHACAAPTVTLTDPRTSEAVTLSCSTEEYAGIDFSAIRSGDHPESPKLAIVETGKWFLVSDDRHIHLDSRDYGQIDPTTCQHITFRLVSAQGWGDKKARLTVIW
jgi:signal peptidase I